MKGITYYKLQSPYFGDITKNCSLNGLEVDQNFFNLEGRDVKSITIQDKNIVISFLNGESISASLESTLTPTYYEFDKEKGVLKITKDGVTQEITGFITADVIKKYVGIVSVDSTLKGNGKPFNPIGLSSSQRTGVYRPVETVLNTSLNEKLPTFNEVKVGDRYLTIEKHCTLGLLYNYEGVKQIACDLMCESKGWRIPTKEDWDDMLNAIEVDNADKNHNAVVSNKLLGNVAGKLLKSNTMWKEKDSDDSCNCHNNESENVNNCHTPYIGELGTHKCSCSNNTKGIDKFGFTVLPVGYADDTKQYQYYLERCWYWTATNQEYTNAFTKRFIYNTNKVYQDVTPTDFYLSLRLVKDYDGSNHYDSEEILGSVYPTVLMPSEKRGNAIWTSVNIDLKDNDYKAITPNTGDPSVFVNKYFINEWNGKKWVRNEVKEGESVVIKKGKNDEQCVEYRVIGGMLVNASSFIYKEVMDDVKHELENIFIQIDNETKRAIEVEEKLQNEISSLYAITTANETEIKNIHNSIEEINNSIETTKSTLSETIDNLNIEIKERIEDVDNEEKRAIEAEKLLEENINIKTDNLEAKIKEVENLLPLNEGTEFNPETGILLIKSGNGENDITVQFSFNFGEI